jgi:Arc/MetJ-type ribon-helix-helix transcriptional regulator
MTQLVTRVSEQLMAEVDRLVDEGVVESRSEAVRLALRHLIENHRRAAVGRQIVEGYRRVPPDKDLEAWAEASGRAMIEAQPW